MTVHQYLLLLIIVEGCKKYWINFDLDRKLTVFDIIGQNRENWLKLTGNRTKCSIILVILLINYQKFISWNEMRWDSYPSNQRSLLACW